MLFIGNQHTQTVIYMLTHITTHFKKNNVLNILVNRAINVSDKEHWFEEKKTLKTALKENGYSSQQINKAFKKQLKKFKNGRENIIGVEKKRAILPYVHGTSDKVGRILGRFGLKPIFQPIKKVKDFLRPIKDKVPLSNSGVYKVPCSCGSVYVGQTKRMVATRLKEHIRHTKYENISKSAIAEHSYISKHKIEFENTQLIAKEHFYFPRIIREAIEIKKLPDNFNNQYETFKLPVAWDPLFTYMKQQNQY